MEITPLEQRLNSLSNGLDKLNHNTKVMVNVFHRFENRLSELDKNIIPIYEATEEYTRMQRNITETVKYMESVHENFKVAREVRSVIRDGMDANPEEFFIAIRKIKDSLRFMEENDNFISSESSKKMLTGLLDQALLVCMNDFKRMLEHAGTTVRLVEHRIQNEKKSRYYLKENDNNMTYLYEPLMPLTNSTLNTIKQIFDFLSTFEPYDSMENNNNNLNNLNIDPDDEKKMSSKNKLEENMIQILNIYIDERKKTIESSISLFYSHHKKEEKEDSEKNGITVNNLGHLSSFSEDDFSSFTDQNIYQSRISSENILDEEDDDIINKQWIALLQFIETLIIGEKILFEKIMPNEFDEELCLNKLENVLLIIIKELDKYINNILDNDDNDDLIKNLSGDKTEYKTEQIKYLLQFLKDFLLFYPKIYNELINFDNLINILIKLHEQMTEKINTGLDRIRHMVRTDPSTTKNISPVGSVHIITSNSLAAALILASSLKSYQTKIDESLLEDRNEHNNSSITINNNINQIQEKEEEDKYNISDECIQFLHGLFRSLIENLYTKSRCYTKLKSNLPKNLQEGLQSLFLINNFRHLLSLIKPQVKFLNNMAESMSDELLPPPPSRNRHHALNFNEINKIDDDYYDDDDDDDDDMNENNIFQKPGLSRQLSYSLLKSGTDLSFRKLNNNSFNQSFSSQISESSVIFRTLSSQSSSGSLLQKQSNNLNNNKPINLSDYLDEEFLTSLCRMLEKELGKFLDTILNPLLNECKEVTEELKYQRGSQTLSLQSGRIIKKRFENFNHYFEELSQEVKTWDINDEEFRNDLIEEMKNKLLPKYKPFFEKWSKVKFSKKHMDQYLRFPPDLVERNINEYFQAFS